MSECKECGCCNGSGYTDPTMYDSFDDPVPDMMVCGVCDGTGHVNKNGDEFPSEIVCPVCGSVDIEIRQDIRSMNPMGAGCIFIDQVNHYCNACKECGDFTGVNDALIDKAIDEVLAKRAIESLDTLAAKGFTPTWIERCLGLHVGFLRKCREQNLFSRETYTLLRFIECQPELLNLARMNYPPIEKVIARIQCDPGILASSTETISDVGNIVGKGDDWVDVEIMDKEVIAKLLGYQSKPYSRGTNGFYATCPKCQSTTEHSIYGSFCLVCNKQRIAPQINKWGDVE